MDAFEKLLLRRARNADLKRGAQWLANLAYASVGADVAAQALFAELGQTMEFYGSYTETEDPDALTNAEERLGRAILLGRVGTRMKHNSTM